MPSSKEFEEIALENSDLLKEIRKISPDKMNTFSDALKGLSSCDVEKGTEPYWLSSAKGRLENLRELYNTLIHVSQKNKIEENIVIGAFRIRQRECGDRPNLSIGRFQDVKRLIRKLP